MLKACTSCLKEKHPLLDFTPGKQQCKECRRDQMRIVRRKEGRDPKDKWKRFNLTYNAKFNTR